MEWFRSRGPISSRTGFSATPSFRPLQQQCSTTKSPTENTSQHNNMMSVQEELIILALAAIENGVSERKAAKGYGVPWTTLQSRHAGRSTAHSGHTHQKRLSKDQESCLCDWIMDQERCGYAPSHSWAKEMASLFLVLTGDTKPLGKKWVPHFVKRNPCIASLIGKPIDAARI